MIEVKEVIRQNFLFCHLVHDVVDIRLSRADCANEKQCKNMKECPLYVERLVKAAALKSGRCK